MKKLTGIMILALTAALSACGGGGSSTPVKAWGTPTLIETNDAENAGSPQIATDAAGNAIAVWQQSDGASLSIYANRYTAGTGWGTPTLIETGTGVAVGPQIAVDAGGNAIAVWRQSYGMLDNIYANRYNVTTGLWDTATLIETGTGGASSPQIAFDPAGNAIAVWVQEGDPTSAIRYDIWANRYNVSTGLWGTATLIETDDTGAAYSPQLAFDANGNAIAVWRQLVTILFFGGQRYGIRTNRYTAGTGWGTATLIDTGLSINNSGAPQIAVDASGNAIAVWYQSDGTRDNIYANRYTAGTGWSTAVLIETDDTGPADSPQIAIDGSGNAIAVWEQDGDPSPGVNEVRNDIWANRYTAGSGWGTATLIETDNAGTAYSPQIAVDAGGNAIAVWEQFDGAHYFNIWANRYQ